MGLDMYLEARNYTGRGWEDEPRQDFSKLMTAIQDTLSSVPLPDGGIHGGITVAINLMYWRKANAIHNWFVEKLGGGVDECQEIYVSEENLVQLRDLCVRVLEYFPKDFEEDDILPDDLGDKVAALLPTANGFFFGSSDYDDWYRRSIVETRDQLTKIIDWIEAEKKAKGVEYSGWDFSYRASW